MRFKNMITQDWVYTSTTSHNNFYRQQMRIQILILGFKGLKGGLLLLKAALLKRG